MKKSLKKPKKIDPLERIANSLEVLVSHVLSKTPPANAILEEITKSITDNVHERTLYITFPEKTAKEIVDECNNTVAGGKLLYSSWMDTESFYTTEKCRPRTVKIPTEIEMAGKSWDECHEGSSDDMFNFAEAVYMLRESESFRKLLSYSKAVRYTWTSSRASGGRLVYVGYFGSDGAPVSGWKPGSSGSGMGVCFSRSE